MLKPRKMLAGTLASGACLLLVAGCGSAGSSPEENVSEVCSAAAGFESALTSFREVLTPEASIEDVRSRWDNVQTAYEDLAEEGADVAQDRVDELKSATGELRSAVENVPDDATLPQAVDSLRSEARGVRTAFESLESELAC